MGDLRASSASPHEVEQKYLADLTKCEEDVSSFLSHLRCNRNLTEAGCIEVANFVNRFCLESVRHSQEYPGKLPEALPAAKASSSWTIHKLHHIFRSTAVK